MEGTLIFVIFLVGGVLGVALAQVWNHLANMQQRRTIMLRKMCPACKMLYAANFMKNEGLINDD